MPNLFSTEQVSKYHVDKFADQISDAILDECLTNDPSCRVAVETLVKGTTCVLAGEVSINTNIDYKEVVKRVSKKLGYKIRKIVVLINEQSKEIKQGVDHGGAGDQGTMFGYATRETESLLPKGFHLANKIIKMIEQDAENNPNTILYGEAKTQVTIDLDTDTIHTILISVRHKHTTIEHVRIYIRDLLFSYFAHHIMHSTVLINPNGTWEIGGPITDAGLTGRKIVCDQYGGYIAVGGGAFSGKDPTKVDRSATYMARYLAVALLKKFPHINIAQVQLAYAIGMVQPVSINVKTDVGNVTYPNIDFARYIQVNYDLTPGGIIKHLDLLKVKYEKIAEGCHFRQDSGLF